MLIQEKRAGIINA